MTHRAIFTALVEGHEIEFCLEDASAQALVNSIQTVTQRAAGAAANAATRTANEAKRDGGHTPEGNATTTAMTAEAPAETAGAQSPAGTETSAPTNQQPVQGVQGVFASPAQVAEYRQNGAIYVGSPEVVPQGFTAVPGPTGGLVCSPVDKAQWDQWIDKNYPLQQANASQTQTAPNATQAAHSAEATTMAGAQGHAQQSAGATGTLNAEEFTQQAREAVNALSQKYGGQDAGFSAAANVLQGFGASSFTQVTADQYAAVLAALRSA